MPPDSTATARIPNATHPQSVLLSDSALFDAAAAPAAAAAAGLTPVVVVDVVVEGTAATVTVSVSLWVSVFVTVTALVVVKARVSVMEAAGAAGRVVVSAGVVVGVVSVAVVVGVLRAGVVRVSVGSVAVMPVETATPSPLPHPAATKTTRLAANPAIRVRATVRE
jgi:hypothetical protein